MIIEGDHQRAWKDGEKHESRLVFIGRKLDAATSCSAGFEACQACVTPPAMTAALLEMALLRGQP